MEMFLIAGIAIGTVILPQLSKHVQSKKKEKINSIQNKALELSLFLSIPAATALLIASEEIISPLFGYGTFDEQSVKNSAKALFYFAIGLPAFSLIKVFSTFFFVSWSNFTPCVGSSILAALHTFLICSLYFWSEIFFGKSPLYFSSITIIFLCNGIVIILSVLTCVNSINGFKLPFLFLYYEHTANRHF